MKELLIDSFAGGGGASLGIELATGRSVDIAINHDEAAILMHKTNHPNTKHYCENIWDVDPVVATGGRPVGLMWASPDCRHFSKAKGGKPVEKKIRGLAWVVLKWAGKVKPRVIILENVEEFVTWGPVRKGKPVKSKKGITFEKFKSQLQSLGYKVEHRELRACDYGAPTTRKRFFLIARCDGKPIVWPEPMRGDPDSLEVRCGYLKPWRTAAECIDWSIPCPSIFNRKKPLAENTLRRIAKGTDKFVIKNPEPFIVQVNHGGDVFRGQNINETLPTVTSKHGYGVVTPIITQIGQTGGGDRLHGIEDPLSTIVSKAEHLFVTPFLTQYHSYDDSARGQELDRPLLTQDTSNRYGTVMPFLTEYYGNAQDGLSVKDPLHTVTSKDREGLTVAHLEILRNHASGQSVKAPINTICTSPGHFGVIKTYFENWDRHQNLGNWPKVRRLLNKYCGYKIADDEILIFEINGIKYFIYDIGMRMLEPRELFRAQGFPDSYIIDHDYTGKPYPKSAQVARCGNAVPPPFAEALVRANLPELCRKEKAS